MSKAEELAEALRTGDRSGIWYSGMEAAAELRRLQAENDALRKQMEAQKDEWLSWEAKREQIEKDAERYRWLRLPNSGVPISNEAARNSDLYDAAIDFAMKAKQ